MGSTLVRTILREEDLILVGGVEEASHPRLNEDLGLAVGEEKIGAILTNDLSKVISNSDVVVDFTNPKASLFHLKIARKAGKAMVIGTTGFTPEEREEIKRLVKGIPCLLSPNMSVGVNLLFKLTREAALTLGDSYDVEIIEAHHRMKKDAPSGTAERLAELVVETSKGFQEKVYGRKGMIGPRKKGEIGVLAVRGGEIVGEHTVIFAGTGERIELIHRAQSREAFAFGTLKAIRFVFGAKPGLYDMEDVLGFEKGLVFED